MDIAEFLLARIAEDAKAAQGQLELRAARYPGETFEGDGETYWVDRGPWLYADPARVLVECEAKRRIVEHHARVAWNDGELGCAVCGVDILPPHEGVQVRETAGWPCPTLRYLALPYAEHPDYDPAWSVLAVVV